MGWLLNLNEQWCGANVEGQTMPASGYSLLFPISFSSIYVAVPSGLCNWSGYQGVCLCWYTPSEVRVGGNITNNAFVIAMGV